MSLPHTPPAPSHYPQVARVYTDKWVGSWFGDVYGTTTAVYLGVFVMLSTAYGMLALARSLTFLFFCLRAAVNTHNRLLDHVLVLPKSFFDTNPAGGSWLAPRVTLALPHGAMGACAQKRDSSVPSATPSSWTRRTHVAWGTHTALV